MQKWEYLFAQCDYDHNKKRWRVRWVNKDELPDWQNGPSLSEFSNQRGEEGWELIADIERGEGTIIFNRRLTFKRPK
jgi:hypothetical protein